MSPKNINWNMCKIILAISLYCIIINYFMFPYFLKNIIESNLTSITVAETQIDYSSIILKTPTQNDYYKNNVSNMYSIHYLSPWHPAKLTTNVESDGPGEGSRPVVLNDSQQIEMKKTYRKHQFNIIASEMISFNRSLLDFRPFKCRAKRYPTLLPVTSIIIVFFNEAWSTLLRTVWSVINRSPRSLVSEILLVDDGSNLDDYVITLPIKTKVIRREKRTGLVGARLLGVQFAKSKVVTFLDAHCECCDGWLEPLLTRIVNKRNSIVSPYIDYISPYTFEHKSLNKLRWGTFDWYLDYKWDLIPQREYNRRKNDDSEPLECPVIAGGVFSIDKDYFNEIGSYDEDTIYWGGENFEISFRAWMCGGTLEIIPCSRVAHVYRNSSPHSFPGGITNTISHNLMRVARVWMDEWKYILYIYNQDTFDVNIGDISKRVALRKSLNCKSFRWYLNNIYPEVENYDGDYYVGQVKNLKTQKCLDTMSRNIGENVSINSCLNEIGGTQEFGYTPENLFLTEDINCLGISNSSEFIQLFKCNRKMINLKWSYDVQDQTIINLLSNKCLEHSITTNNSSILVLNDCNGSRNQKWILNLLKT